MSNHVMSWAWKQNVEDAGAKLLLVKLADQSHDNGECWPSRRTLADECCMSPRTVVRKLHALRDSGFIEIHERRRAAGGQTSNLYIMRCQPVTPAVKSDERGDTPDTPPVSPVSPQGTLIEPKGVRSSTELLRSSSDSLTTANENEPPPLTKINGQNLGFNALTAECGISAKDKAAAREVAAALNGDKSLPGIRRMAWDELVEKRFGEDATAAQEVVAVAPDRFEGYVARLVEHRAAAYRTAWPGITITPLALRKWWLRLDALAQSGGGGMTPEQMRNLDAA